MIKIIACAVLLCMVTNLFSQETNPEQTFTQQDYLKKSKSQKTAAWILLGGGVTLIAIAAPGNVSFDVLPVLAIGATLFTLGSIPLFIASAKNKRRAKNASVGFNILKNPVTLKPGFAFHSYPALSIKVNF